MAYSIACADAGVDCPGAFTTETRDELMEHIGIHATAAHPDMQMDEETMAKIEAGIKTV